MPPCALVALRRAALILVVLIGATDRFPVATAPLIGATDQNDMRRPLPGPNPVDLIGTTDHSRVGGAESIGPTDHRAVERGDVPP